LDTDEIKFESYEIEINVSIGYKWLCFSWKAILKKNIEN
jgi:hypothetical protein